MNIQKISKKKREAIVSLSADELVKICNALYGAEDSHKNELYYRLYSDMTIARDLCQYGHIDDFCLEQIAKAREKAREKAEEKKEHQRQSANILKQRGETGGENAKTESRKQVQSQTKGYPEGGNSGS